MDKDISNLSYKDRVLKYKNMKEFIIRTLASEGMSEEYILNSCEKRIDKTPVMYNVEPGIILTANSSEVYTKDNKLIMIKISDFIVVSN